MKHLLIAGWRGLGQSFAMVNQHQILALSRNGGVILSHVDMPFRCASWNRDDHDAGFSSDEQALIDSLPPADEDSVDCVYRICVPLYPPSHHARKTLTFTTAEFGYYRSSSLYNPEQKLNDITPGDSLLVTSSRWSRDRLLDFGFAEGKVRVIPLGVNLSSFSPLSEDELILQRRSLSIPSDTVIFINVGPPTWNKGIDLLLRSFASIHRRHPNTRLILKDARHLYRLPIDTIIQGVNQSCPGLLTSEVLASILVIPGNLTWQQLRLLYGFADWYVSPYRAEGFNLPVLEAQACGTPVIVSSGGATDDFCNGESTRKIASVFHREILANTPDQNFSFWVEPNILELERLMAQAAEEGPRKSINSDTLRRLARENANEYSWDRAATEIVSLI